MSPAKSRVLPDIISAKTRRELQEYFVGNSTLREIEHAFDDAGIERDFEKVVRESSERRCLVQQYYATLDFTDWDDARRFLSVFANVLFTLENVDPDSMAGEYAQKEFRRLSAFVRRDGFEYRDGRLIAIGSVPNAAQLKAVAVTVDAPYLLQQIEHIETQIEADPRLAIGTSKDLVETICKTILRERGVEFDPKLELMDLVKLTRKELKLVPDDVPDSAKAADTIRKLLSNLASITQSLAELRNSYGTGHGHDGKAKGLTPRHARLAAGAATVLAKFLFETHQHHSDDSEDEPRSDMRRLEY